MFSPTVWDVETAVQRLLIICGCVEGTKKGSNTTQQLRGRIEEAQVHAISWVLGCKGGLVHH